MILGGPTSGKSLLCHYMKSIYSFEIVKLPGLEYEDLISESYNDEQIELKKKEILEETEIKIKYMLDNWQRTFVVYPILFKEQTDYLSRRNYFYLLSIETPTLNRYLNYKEKYPALHSDLESFIKLDDRLSYKIMNPEKEFIVKTIL